MPQPEIVNDGITARLKKLFEDNVEDICVLWKDLQAGEAPKGQDPAKGKIYKVFTDLQEELRYTPAIEINEVTARNSIVAIGTQDDEYAYEIICTVENNHPEYSKKYIQIFGKAIFDLLNAFVNRDFIVPGYDFKVYYSEATDIAFNFRRGRGLKSAKMNWTCKIRKGNRF